MTFAVRVIPRSSVSAIVGEHGGALKIKLTSAPVEGAENDELVKLLAKTLGVPGSSVEIRSGQRSKLKSVTVHHREAGEIIAILQAKS